MIWQPIKTLPKFDWEAGRKTKGPYLDVWAVNKFGKGRRFTNVRQVLDFCGGDAGWLGVPLSWEPTHWVLTPEPPE